MKIVKQRELGVWHKSFALFPVTETVLEKDSYRETTIFLEHYWQRKLASRQDRTIKSQIMTCHDHYRLFVAETSPAYFSRKASDGNVQPVSDLFTLAYNKGQLDYSVEGISEYGGQMAHALAFMADAEKIYQATGLMGEALVTKIFGTTYEEYAYDKLTDCFTLCWSNFVDAKTHKLPNGNSLDDICMLLVTSKLFKGYHWARQIEYMQTLFTKERIVFLKDKKNVITQINVLKHNKTVDLEIKIPT